MGMRVLIEDHEEGLSVELPGRGGDGTRTARGTVKVGRALWNPSSSVKLGTELSVPPVFMFFPVPWEQRSDPL